MITWKILIAGGLSSLIICSILIMLVFYRLVTFIKSNHRFSIRDQHQEPIPRLGGVAISWSFWVVLILLIWLPFEQRGIGIEALSMNRLIGLVLGSMIAWGLGFADDLWTIRARWKLLGQISLGVLAVYFGFAIENIEGPLFQNVNIGFWSIPLTILWIVGIMNAINLIDGLDGLSSAIILIILITLSWLAHEMGKIELMLLMIVLIGSVISFLSFNLPPASIFMGDSGSYFLGYLVAVISIWVCEKSTGTVSLFPLLILAVPIIDTTFSIFRRFLKGIPFYSADKDHLHHRLLAKGLTPAEAVLTLSGVSIVYCSLALAAHYFPEIQTYAYLSGIGLIWVLLYFLEYDVIRRPVSSIRGQHDLRKRRDLMIALAEQMDNFFSKDNDLSSTLSSFNYWCGLADISQYQIIFQNKNYYKYGNVVDSLRIIIYKIENWEIHLGLPRDSWTLDSDIKGDLIEKVSHALVRKIGEFESSKIVDIQHRRDSSSLT
ncbi:MAG: MraY family glycosyltransferase [bacterium]